MELEWVKGKSGMAQKLRDWNREKSKTSFAALMPLERLK
jgi:hypothetical protein